MASRSAIRRRRKSRIETLIRRDVHSAVDGGDQESCALMVGLWHAVLRPSLWRGASTSDRRWVWYRLLGLARHRPCDHMAQVVMGMLQMPDWAAALDDTGWSVLCFWAHTVQAADVHPGPPRLCAAIQQLLQHLWRVLAEIPLHPTVRLAVLIDHDDYPTSQPYDFDLQLRAGVPFSAHQSVPGSANRINQICAAWSQSTRGVPILQAYLLGRYDADARPRAMSYKGRRHRRRRVPWALHSLRAHGGHEALQHAFVHGRTDRPADYAVCSQTIGDAVGHSLPAALCRLIALLGW